MSTMVFEDGVLVEQWDDATATYTRFESGEEVESRPYTADEQARADEAVQAEAEQVEKTVRREAREALLDATLELSVACTAGKPRK